jgi:multidrug efflux pump subunit AcrB
MAIGRQSLLYLTLTDAQITSNFRNLVIINNGKGIITLKDIATVAIEAKEYIKVNANGKESVLIDIKQLITMSTDMDAKLKLNNPQDIKITPYYEQSSFVAMP